MINMGSTEILIIALVILLIFGSKKLSEFAKGVGKTSKELKKAKAELNDALLETDQGLKNSLDLKQKKDKRDEAREVKAENSNG